MATQAQILQATGKFLMPNYGRLPIAMDRGSGATIRDADGKEYIDFFAGFGACGVAGHCHQSIVSAVQTHAGRLTCCGNVFTNAPQVELARLITHHAFGGKVFFCHSGAEANETALKLARLAAGKGKYKILSFHHAFHGRTMGALSLTSRKFQKGFEPILQGNIRCDYGNLDEVRQAVDEKTAAIIVEPIQGEGGVNIPTPEFMKGLRKFCDDKEIILIFDEVWTSPARTGRWFAYQMFDVKPDIMTLGKALGGGLPLAACVASEKYQDVLQPGTHGCTMGGNPLCAVAGVAVMNLIETEQLTMRAAVDGLEIASALQGANLSCVKNIRGAGMMIGIELNKLGGSKVVNKCLEKGLIINCTRDFILRLAPPLTIKRQLMEKGVGILIDVLKKWA